MGNEWVSGVDPDGRFAFAAVLPILKMALTGAAKGALLGGVVSEDNGGKFWDGAWRGALAGGLTSGLGEVFSKSFLSLGLVGGGVVKGSIIGAAASGLNATLKGTNIAEAMLNGAMIGGLAGGALGAIKRMNLGGVDDFEIPDENDYVDSKQFFKSKTELHKFISDKIGNPNEIQTHLKTDIDLANKSNLPNGRRMDGHMIRNGKTLVGGVTFPKGGWFNSIKSQVLIAPGVKGIYYNNINISKMVINHELIHAYHHTLKTPYNSKYSKSAASSYSLFYSHYYKMETIYGNFSKNIINHPANYSWVKLNGLISLFGY
jgi:hypothetical protein